MSRVSPVPRSRSRTSLLSNNTYYSFYDAVSFQRRTPLPAEEVSKPATPAPPPRIDEMQRHDSGYESTSPRAMPLCPKGYQGRRTVTMATTATGSPTTTSSSHVDRLRSTTRRSMRAARMSKAARTISRSSFLTQTPPIPLTQYAYHDGGSLCQYHPPVRQRRTSYFHFPSPDPAPLADVGVLGDPTNTVTAITPVGQEYAESASYPVPPPTTHYWTSDRTRRLEYAAIDATRHGFRGWVMRHMVPGCFVPKAQRRVGFDDESGSVRRYRLELESEESGEKAELTKKRSVGDCDGKKRGWLARTWRISPACW